MPGKGWEDRKMVQRVLVEKYGARLEGFYDTLRAIAAQYAEDEAYDDAKDCYYELFGQTWGAPTVRPAAYRYDEAEREMHVFEVEITNKVGWERLREYGEMADRDSGVHFSLHVFDKYGHEFATIDNDFLANYSLVGLEDTVPHRKRFTIRRRRWLSAKKGIKQSFVVDYNEHGKRRVRSFELKKDAEAWVAIARLSWIEQLDFAWRTRGELTPVSEIARTTQVAAQREDERAILRAVYEMGLIKPGDDLNGSR